MREVRAALADRLRERLPEIQAAVTTRVHSIADPRDVADPAYLEALKAAVVAAVDHRLAMLEAGERQAPAVPAVLLVQARLDARDGVPLDAVLRRYHAGNTLFGDFLVEEAERAEVPSSVLRRLLGEQATLGDRLLAAVSAEHTRETQNRPRSAMDRRRELALRLGAGELIDTSELGYELDVHHLGMMVKGERVEEFMRGVASTLDCRLLAVQREEEPKWACWLGRKRRLETEEALRVLADVVPAQTIVTIGEPAEGLPGWRFSHLQAKAALPLAERMGRSVLRYADVAVLASILNDDLATNSLRQLHLAPLEQARDGGKLARETLRAYFDAERNVSSTAAALGVDRRTVRNRIRAIEELLGRPLRGSVTDLEIALRLDE